MSTNNNLGTGYYYCYDPNSVYNDGIDAMFNFVQFGAARHYSYEISQMFCYDLHRENLGSYGADKKGTLIFVDQEGYTKFDYPKDWKKIISDVNSFMSSYGNPTNFYFRYGFIQEGGPVAKRIFDIMRKSNGLHSFLEVEHVNFELFDKPLDEIDDNEIAKQQLEWIELRNQYPLGNITRFDYMNPTLTNILFEKEGKFSSKSDRYKILRYFVCKQIALCYFEGKRVSKNPINSLLISLQHLGVIEEVEQNYLKAACIFSFTDWLTRHFAGDNFNEESSINVAHQQHMAVCNKMLDEFQKNQVQYLHKRYDSIDTFDLFEFLWHVDDLCHGTLTIL